MTSFDLPVHGAAVVNCTVERTPQRLTLRFGVRPRESPRVVTVDKATYCLVTEKQYDGEDYCCLMVHNRPNTKTDANVFYGRDPFHQLAGYNTQRIRDRTTSQAAPFWRAEAVVGPLRSVNEAQACATAWVQNSRGKAPRSASRPMSRSSLRPICISTVSRRTRLSTPF